MGWKISPPKPPQSVSTLTSTSLLLGSSNKTNSMLNTDEDSSHSTSSTSPIKKSQTVKKKYNIYDKYPEHFPELSEQGDIDACVPNCISTIYYYNTFKQGNHLNFRISRLFLYYNVRKIYNELSDDAGSRIIDCIKILKRTGVPPEIVHPYHEKLLYKQPSELSVKLAKYCKLLGFKELGKDEIKQNLLLDNPVICGIKVYENFNNVNTIRTGQVVMPSDDEEILGGHSIIIVGFDDNKKNYIFLNSWGKLWGNNGIGYIPYDYILNEDLSDEFFILTKVTNPIIDFFDGGHITNNKISPNIKTNNMNNSSQIIKILLLSILIIIHSL
jgi:C1A family cysteine protease